jgi:hypothetical protein
LVGAGLAVGDVEDDENDRSDEWNKSDENPPSAAAGVMETADGECDKRKNDGQGVEAGEDPVAVLAAESEGSFDQAQDDEGDDVEEHKHPVGFAAGAALEVDVVFPSVEIPVHREMPFLFWVWVDTTRFGLGLALLRGKKKRQATDGRR